MFLKIVVAIVYLIILSSCVSNKVSPRPPSPQVVPPSFKDDSDYDKYTSEVHIPISEAGIDTNRFVYRGDSRDYKDIFKSGFDSKSKSKNNSEVASKSDNFIEHALTGGKNSVFISTTTDFEEAIIYGRTKVKSPTRPDLTLHFVYEIQTNNDVWSVNTTAEAEIRKLRLNKPPYSGMENKQKSLALDDLQRAYSKSNKNKEWLTKGIDNKDIVRVIVVASEFLKEDFVFQIVKNPYYVEKNSRRDKDEVYPLNYDACTEVWNSRQALIKPKPATPIKAYYQMGNKVAPSKTDQNQGGKSCLVQD